MITLHITKPIHGVISKAVKVHCLKGHWPEVQYKEARGAVSFSMWPFGDVLNLYTRVADEWLMANGELLGVFTRRRSASLIQRLEEVLYLQPVGSKDVQVGSLVRLSAIPDISKRFREAKVDMCRSPELPMIMEGWVKEENGYYGEHGSFYHHELRMLMVDGIWRPIELTREEKEYPRE